MNFKLSDISQYRNQYMGIAIIWVMIYHFGFKSPLLKEIASIGYIGVDIFIFLSGFGLFYSLNKTANFSYFKYIKRRLNRILPTYCIIGALLSFLFYHDSFGTYLWKCSTLGFWINNIFHDWYIPSIIALYFTYPLIYKILIKNEKLFFILLFIMILFPTPFMFLDKCGRWQYHLVYRIPIFLWGAYVAKQTFFSQPWNNKFIKISLLCFIVALFMAIILKGHFIQYALSFSVPIAIIVLSLLFKRINITEGGYLSILGTLTLEIYLTHLVFLRLYKTMNMILLSYSSVIGIVFSILSIILALYLNKLLLHIKEYLINHSKLYKFHHNKIFK